MKLAVFSPWNLRDLSLHFCPLVILSKQPAIGQRVMTKQKTHKSTKKRFRVTATGKVKHRKCGTSHLAIAKSAKKIRHLRGTRVLEPAYTRAVVDALRGNSY